MTLRPKRHRGDMSEFEDPLKNYDPPTFADEMERSLAQDPVTVIEHKPFTAVPPQTTIEKVMRTMAELDVACVLVTEADHLLGIFSERDILTKVAADYEKMKGEPVAKVMTPKPVAVHETDTAGKALNLMAYGGFRHVPILDADDHVIGVLGPRRVTAYLQKYL